MLYYASFEGVSSEIMEFTTEEARDNWVSFKDDFSVDFDIKKGDGDFERRKVTDLGEVVALLNDNRVCRLVDEFVPDMVVYYIPVTYGIVDLEPAKIT